MSTVNDLIKDALEEIGVVAADETPTASDLQMALRSLNKMLDSFSNDGLAIYKYVREIFPLVGGKSKYTMGPSGDFDTERPIEINQVKSAQSLTGTSQADYSVPIEFSVRIMNIQQWADTQIKNLESNLVTDVYPEGTTPLETINVWPVPQTGSAIVIYSKKTLGTFSNVSENVVLPAGYEEMISYNLAKRLANKYGKSLSAEATEIANESYAKIKRTNTKPLLMKSDAFGMSHGGRFNIYTGEYDI